jgi:hypothetical protein
MKRAEPGWFVLTLAGFAALLGSFLPFYTYTAGVDVTVWSRGLFPTAALIPLLGLAIGLQALFVLILGHEPRSPFLNFTWEQVRLAAGAFMILLALSYLLQDRAGGSFGSGYLVLSLASLVTFAGGVMTRRAQLARAGEEAPARKRQVQLKPAIAGTNRRGAAFIAAVGRFGVALARNVGAFGRSAGRGTAAVGRNVRAHLGFGEANAAKQATTLDAKLEGRLDVQPPPPAPPPPPPTETVPEPVDTTIDEPVVEPVDTTADEPVETPDEEPVEATVDAPVEKPVEEIADEPVEATADEPTEEIATEPARIATLSAVPPEPEPDKSAAPDGGGKVTASKPRRRRQPAKKVEQKVEEKVEENEPADDEKEPQRPAAPG